MKMGNEKNEVLQAKEIDPSELDKIAGGYIVKIAHRNGGGYYVPKNGKFYKNYTLASETDKALGGSGSVGTWTTCYDELPFSDVK